MPTESLRIAIIHDWLVTYRGGEKVLEAICELFPNAKLFSLFHAQGKTSDTIERHAIHASFLNCLPFRAKIYRHLLPLFPIAVEKFDLSDFDLVISSSHCAAKGVIPSPDAIHICYCHTPMRYAWDRYRDYFGSKAMECFILPFIHYLRMWDVTSSARVDYFLTNSKWVGARIEKYYRRSFEVIHPFADISATEINLKLRENFYLVVSGFAPYKRIDLAIRACAQLNRKLIIVGEGQDARSLKKLARGSQTEFVGRVSQTELVALYGKAKALLFPGEEDFGIAPLEAMACGTPVIAFGKGGVTETVEEHYTGEFFFERTADSLRDAIVFFEKQTYDPKRCRARAEQFTKEKFQRAFLKSVKEKLAIPHPSLRSFKEPWQPSACLDASITPNIPDTVEMSPELPLSN